MSILNWIKSYEFNSLIGLITYWFPLAICVIVYSIGTLRDYRGDIESSKKDYYNPSLTVGTIVCRILASIIPVFNIFAMVFDCMASVFRWIGEVFDFPLVPKRKCPKS